MKTNRIESTLAALKAKQEKALVLFTTAGFPSLETAVTLVPKLAGAGADIIEIGMPYSDPLADGPVIQASSLCAIHNGITLEIILRQIQEIRRQTSVPIILMGYLTPILHYGAEKFFADAAQAGADGVILPEVPLEESEKYFALTQKNTLADILLVSPTTEEKRIRELDAHSSGFLYCVSTTGVTGKGSASDIHAYVQRVKRNAKKNAVLVGFGIRTPEDAQRVSRDADGVIIGSALIQKLEAQTPLADIFKWVAEVKKAMR
ncbi:MAG TPA: tryptophan synthase subunit alpha [Bacteroidota bacterium]|nr:tryptophan synthase subunit alpha [Bacteroidota bacterium]